MRFLKLSLFIATCFAGTALAADQAPFNSSTISGLGARNIGSGAPRGRGSAREAAARALFISSPIAGVGARNIGSAARSGRVPAIDAAREPNGKLTIFVGAA